MSTAFPQPRALSYRDALRTIVDSAAPLADVLVPLHEAYGRALAGSVNSDMDLPPWDNAGMDGYAVRREDVAGASQTQPVILDVRGTIAAGADVTSLSVGPRECMRIMTGAPVPAGADCVVRIEDTDHGEDIVRIVADRDAHGRGNVRPRGEDVHAGELLFGPGTSITSTHLGVLASIGVDAVRVHRKPRVTIVSSGDELVLLDQFDRVRSGQSIVSSTTYALPPLLTLAGADVTVLPIARDDLHAVSDTLERALRDGCDLLVTTGGVSVGAHDYTREALQTIGGTVDFWRARIRPGGPIGTGAIGDTRWLGLPGNPVSSMVTGLLFAWPLIRRMAGHARVHHLPVRVRMRDRAETAAPLTHFLRIVLEPAADGTLEAMLAGPQGSNLMRTLAHAQALLEVPESTDVVQPGELFDAILLPEFALTSVAP